MRLVIISFNIFKDSIFMLNYVYVCVGVGHVNAVPVMGTRSCGIPWSWSDKWLWAIWHSGPMEEQCILLTAEPFLPSILKVLV